MGGRTWQFLLEVLVVFVAVFVGCDVGTSFRVAYVLHLMGVLFDAYFANVPQCAHYRRHDERGCSMEVNVCISYHT